MVHAFPCIWHAVISGARIVIRTVLWLCLTAKCYIAICLFAKPLDWAYDRVVQALPSCLVASVNSALIIVIASDWIMDAFVLSWVAKVRCA